MVLCDISWNLAVFYASDKVSGHNLRFHGILLHDGYFFFINPSQLY